MKVYRLLRKQHLQVSLTEAWDFFASPANLQAITPPYMNFQILDQYGEEEMYAGQIICYRVNIFPNVPVHWTTEITHVKPGEMFVDEQRSGPYSLWHHQHHFRETDNGMEMTDDVHYALPAGFLGRAMHRLFVERQLCSIFDYRRDTLADRFSERKVVI